MRVIACISFLFTLLITSYSQEIVIKNAYSGELLESVAVFNQNKSRSTISDENGVVDLVVFKDSDTLFFQHPSFERYSVSYNRALTDKVILLERKNILLQEFVITASKHSEKKKDVPYMVDVLSPKKLESVSAQNSADILASTGNIFIQKSQVGGGSPVIRGFEANKVLLVVDGVRMNNAIYRSGHLQNSLTIDNAVLDRVEVIYGPSSVIYGSDALGGVVHYITKTPKFRDTTNKIFVEGSAYMQMASANSSNKSHLDINIGFKKVAFLSSITNSNYGNLRTGNFRNPFFEDWGTYPNYVENVGGVDYIVQNSNQNVVPNSGYSQLDFLQKICYKPGQNTNVVLNLQYSTTTDINRQDQLNDTLDDGRLEYAEWYYGPQDRLLASVKTSVVAANSFFNTMDATLAYQNIKESRIVRGFEVDTAYQQFEGVQIATGNFDFYRSISNKSSVNYGLDINYNYVSSEALKRSKLSGEELTSITRYPDEGTNTMATGAYVSYKTRLHPKLLTSVGLRYQFYRLNAKYGNYYEELSEVFQDVNLETQAITSSLSFIVNQTRSFDWNVVFSTGFRSPNLDDLAKIRLTSGKLTIPNPELVPEYSYNAEVGASLTLDGYILLNGNVFFTYLTDAITREPYVFSDGSDSLLFQGSYRTTYQNKNSTEALLGGFSISLLSDFNSNVSFKSTLNYTKGENITDKKPLAHIPPIFGRTNLSYELEKLKLEVCFVYAGWKYSAEMVDTGEDKEDEAMEFGYPNWYTVNFNSSYKINKHLIFQLAIENLTDNYYKPFASGVPAPGINFVGTLRLSF